MASTNAKRRGIRKRGDSYQIRTWYDGQPITGTLRGGTWADAEALKAKLIREAVDQKIGKPRAERSIEDALVEWLKTEARELRSYENLKSKVRAIEPYVRGLGISQLGRVAETIKSERGKKVGDGEITNSTINRRLAILRRIGNLAFRKWRWTQINYGQQVMLLPENESRMVFLTHDEVRDLAAAAPPLVGQAIRAYAYTGLRENELLRLTEANVRVVPREGRTVRHIMLGNWTKNRQPRVVPMHEAIDDVVVPLGLTYDQLRRGFEKARAELDMEHVRIHDLRHTFASWYASTPGANILVLKQLLGHKSIASTMIYAHLFTDVLEAGVASIQTGARA